MATRKQLPAGMAFCTLHTLFSMSVLAMYVRKQLPATAAATVTAAAAADAATVTAATVNAATAAAATATARATASATADADAAVQQWLCSNKRPQNTPPQTPLE